MMASPHGRTDRARLRIEFAARRACARSPRDPHHRPAALPVITFAPMSTADRVAAKHESLMLPASALGLKLYPPIALPLRVSVELPRIEISEDPFGAP